MVQRVVLWSVLGLGLIASLLTGLERARVEHLNRTVELVADYSEAAQLAAGSGKSVKEVLKALKSAGITSVAISEPTIGDLMAQGRAAIRYPQDTDEKTLLVVDRMLASQLTAQLRRLLGDSKVLAPPLVRRPFSGDYALITISQRLPAEYVQLLPAGIPEQPIQEATSAGLSVVARLTNYPGATPASIRRILEDVHARGMPKIVFQGDQVLGFKGAVKNTARSIRRLGLVLGRIEFAKQKGELELAKHAEGNVIPVHSITQNEMPTLSQPDIVERYRKAVRERGVRLCYVRMYETASHSIVDENCDYVRRIAKAIEKDGYVLGKSNPIPNVKLHTWQMMLAGAGIAAGVLLAVTTLVDLSASSCLAWLVLGIAVCSLLAWSGDFGRKIAALIGALTFPTLGAILASRGTTHLGKHSLNIVAITAARVLAAALVSIAGGLLAVGLLSSRTFMLRIDQFAGIKAAHVIPILCVAACFAGGIAWQSDTWTNQKKKLVESYRNLLCSPVMIWQAIGIVFLLVVIGLMVARSGNEAGVGVSTFELKFRALLDRILLVRPRTKEFLVGYPALIAGVVCALHGRKRSAAVLITVGCTALVSVVNTFCHIHTPLAVSAVRTVNGLIVGGIVGTVVWYVLGKLLMALEPPDE
ncbi:MAG: DUF5693 family protein [Armatimonadota bacterium]|nr:DUF5693 family protein [Armatimonadota bacterium]